MMPCFVATEEKGEDGKPVRWAFDTETQDGKAVLLTVAGPEKRDGSLLFPKSFRACVEFLASHADRFMAYNMDYDARALLKFLPQGALLSLYRDEFVLWRGFSIRYRAGREFVVSWGEKIVRVFDLAIHFQRSLRQAVKDVFGKDLKSVIPESWYPRMGKILRRGGKRAALILDYALQDARVTRDLWIALDTQFRALGIDSKVLSRPLSPGAMAAGFFGDKIKFKNLPQWAQYSAKKAYAGGRIEIFQRGNFPRVWGYDLKSAYPWALSTLPDPHGLEFLQGADFRADALYSVFFVHVNIPLDVSIPPIPAWKEKTRVYPIGRYMTWVTGPEAELLQRRGWLLKIIRGYHLVGDARPWLGPDIRRLFKIRKTHPEYSQAVKLVLNSIYGKLAQQDERKTEAMVIDRGVRSVGGKFVRTKKTLSSTSNFFVAAYTTALVRLRLWEVLDHHKEDAVLAATDGVLLTRPLARKFRLWGSSLGKWEEKIARARAVVVGTGVYAVKTPGGWEDKVRGFRPTAPLVKLLHQRGTKIRMKSRVAYTLGDYAVRGAALNKIVDVPRTLDTNFDDKRGWPCPWKSAKEILRKRQTSRPPLFL